MSEKWGIFWRDFSLKYWSYHLKRRAAVHFDRIAYPVQRRVISFPFDFFFFKQSASSLQNSQTLMWMNGRNMNSIPLKCAPPTSLSPRWPDLFHGTDLPARAYTSAQSPAGAHITPGWSAVDRNWQSEGRRGAREDDWSKEEVQSTQKKESAAEGF